MICNGQDSDKLVQIPTLGQSKQECFLENVLLVDLGVNYPGNLAVEPLSWESHLN